MVIALFIYTLSVFGFCYVIGAAKISQGLRETMGIFTLEMHERGHRTLTWFSAHLLELIQCPACLGFWIGGGVGLIHPAGIVAPLDSINFVILAFYTAGINFILGKLTGLIE